MEDKNKTIDQLIKELAGTREQIAELEKVVTELKKDEKILKENEEKYHRFFTTAPTAWAYQKLIVDENEKPVDYVFLEVNYAFEKMTGLKKENIIGKSVTEVLPGTEKEPADWLGKYGEVALTGKTLKFENYSAALNKWFFVSASSTEQGFFTTVFEDITERKEAEMALAESKDKFRGLVETTSDWIWEVNEKAVYTYVSPKIFDMLGYKPEEVIGKTPFDFMPTEEAKRVAEIFNPIAASKKPFQVLENVNLHKNGHPVILETSGTPFFDADGTLLGYRGIDRDITERKRTQVETERLFNLTDYMICIAGMDGYFKRINLSFEEILGYSSEELLAKPFIEFVHPDDREKTVSVVEEKLSRGAQAIGFENRYLCKDGSYKWLSWTARPIVEEGIMYAIAYDVTERKKAEEVSRFLGRITEQVSDSIIATDLNEKITYVNQSFQNLYGYSREELLGKHPDILNAEPDLEQIQSEISKTISSGGVWRGELKNKKKNGNKFICEVTVFPMFDQGGNVSAFGSVQRDVTQRKKTEEELHKVQKLESVGVLAGGIAHDFNNLLTAIMNNLFIMKMHAKDDGKIYERIEATEKASKRAQALTHQLLTFSRGGVPVKVLTDLGELIKESAALALRGANVRCEFILPDGLWHVEADTGQINQVLNNIIINADQSMPEGGIMSIICENIAMDAVNTFYLPKGEYIKISVKDQGIGISKDHLLKIFDPYFSTKQKGSGLGLSTAFSIVKNHSGHIDVESKMGVGTVFNIYLPASRKKASIEKLAEDVPIKGEGKILIMDDDESIRESLGHILNSIGYTHEFTSDGKEAIDVYKNALGSNKPFDALIMDLTIPGGIGGKEAIKELTEIDPKVKAIVSSGYSYDPIMANFRDYGFSAVLSKPYKDIMELSVILSEVIRGTD